MDVRDECTGQTHLKVNKSYSEFRVDILHPRCLVQYYRFNDWQRETGNTRPSLAVFMTADLSEAVKHFMLRNSLHRSIMMARYDL